MFLHWFRKQFGVENTPAAPKHNGPYLSQYVVFGMHRYRTADEDSTVYYIDEAKGIRKKVVDKQGRICNFPGFVRQDCWVREVSATACKPQIRFRTDFEKRDGRFLMLWQIQPDGRYWEDDEGFGAEHEQEVILYAFLTDTGDFDGPFRVYQVGNTTYYTGP